MEYVEEIRREAAELLETGKKLGSTSIPEIQLRISVLQIELLAEIYSKLNQIKPPAPRMG